MNRVRRREDRYGKGGRVVAVLATAVVALAAVAVPGTASAAERAVAQASAAPDLVVTSPDRSVGSTPGLEHGVDIANVGGPATGVVVEIEVPAGLVVRSATHGWFANPCTVTASTVRCTLGQVAAGSYRFVSLKTEAQAVGAHQLQVSATGNEADANPADNTARPTITVPLPDVSTLIEVDDDVAVDETFAAVVLVEHTGIPSPVVTLTVTVSSDLVIEKAAIGWFSVPCSVVGSTASCSLGTMASTSRFVALDLRATAPGAPTISATAGNGQVDRVPANDTAVVAFPVEVPELVDLAFTTTSFQRVVGPGASFREQAHLNNLASVDATEVVVTATVPEGTGITSATADGGSCTVDGRVATCTVASLRAGFTQSVTLAMVAPAVEGPHAIVWTATSSVPDPRPLDNTLTLTFIVGPPDLRATILEWPTSATVGTPFRARVDISNRGAAEPNAVLRLVAPPELTIESAAIGFLSRPCTISGSTATCNVGELSNTLRFVLVTLRPTQAGPATFTAIAGIGGPDGNPDDNTATATVVVS